MKSPLCSLSALLLLTGCVSTIHRVNQLSPGMTKTQVLTALGQPETSMSPGNGVEVLKYVLKKQRPPLKVPLSTEYVVRLVDGRVEAYGTPKDFAVFLDPRERTVNVNIKAGTNTTIAPAQPHINIIAK